jgi:hypothetical protein
VSELRDPVDGQEQVEFALGQAQLAGVDVDIADRGLGEAFTLRRLVLVLGQSGDAVADQAAVQGTTAERRDGLPQAAEDIVERQQGAAPERDDDRLLGLGEDAAAGLTRPHGRIGGAGSAPPFSHRLGVQVVLGGQGAGRRLRRLELGSNSRRRSG